jgi:hypothetical protein
MLLLVLLNVALAVVIVGPRMKDWYARKIDR